jgi:hypothetical protein
VGRQPLQATIDLAGNRPEDLAATLAGLAEDRYAQAGDILARRADEWQPQGDLQQLTEYVRESGQRLRYLEAGLTGEAGGSIRRRRSQPGDRRQLEVEHDALSAGQRALTVRLGRQAPEPSIKEADDTLSSAGLLEERAAVLRAGLAEVEEAERMRADAALAAQKGLVATEKARLEALQGARRTVEAAEAAHIRVLGDARARLRSILTPGAGELKAGLSVLRLHARLLETPLRRLAAAGLTALTDTAPELWRQHRETLADIVVLESPETETIDDSRLRLARAQGETPELVEARRKVLELGRRLIAPPARFGRRLSAFP